MVISKYYKYDLKGLRYQTYTVLSTWWFLLQIYFNTNTNRNIVFYLLYGFKKIQ